MQYAEHKNPWIARLHYIFSFYGLIDLVAVLPFVGIYIYRETPHVNLVVLAYILIIFIINLGFRNNITVRKQTVCK